MTSDQQQLTYSPRWIRFVRVAWHTEAYWAAYLDQSQSSRNELERLRREYATLPPRHDCTCRCPNEARGGPACSECHRLRLQRVQHDIGAEIGRTSPTEAAMPSVLVLDLERALAVLGPRVSATRVSHWLNGESEEDEAA